MASVWMLRAGDCELTELPSASREPLFEVGEDVLPALRNSSELRIPNSNLIPNSALRIPNWRNHHVGRDSRRGPRQPHPAAGVLEGTAADRQPVRRWGGAA